jgi:HEAT repeat protein
MAFITVPELPAADLVELLADPHRSAGAYARLRKLGSGAAEAAREGLRHDDARVRQYCCVILDHVLDDASIGPLIQALDDPAARVRMQAVHALACDRCKKGACRPAPQAVLPRAIALLASDPSAHVRAYAAELVGRFAHSHPAACEAISNAAAHDPSPAVRKKASWYAPGGTIYQRHRS